VEEDAIHTSVQATALSLGQVPVAAV